MSHKITLTVEFDISTDASGAGPRVAADVWNDLCVKMQEAKIFKHEAPDSLAKAIRLIKTVAEQE